MNIEFKNIHKSFGQKKILEGINFSIPQEQIFCIMGESGSGKTTAANILAGILEPDIGEIIGIADVRAAMVFQEERLLPWLNAIENIKFAAGSAYSQDKALRLFSELKLADAMNKSVAELSGGMQRRLSIIRALSADFDLLILDEAFKGLDEATKRKAMDVIIHEAIGKTVVLITHDYGDALYFKKSFKVNLFNIGMANTNCD